MDITDDIVVDLVNIKNTAITGNLMGFSLKTPSYFLYYSRKGAKVRIFFPKLLFNVHFRCLDIMRQIVSACKANQKSKIMLEMVHFLKIRNFLEFSVVFYQYTILAFAQMQKSMYSGELKVLFYKSVYLWRFRSDFCKKTPQNSR